LILIHSLWKSAYQ